MTRSAVQDDAGQVGAVIITAALFTAAGTVLFRPHLHQRHVEQGAIIGQRLRHDNATDIVRS